MALKKIPTAKAALGIVLFLGLATLFPAFVQYLFSFILLLMVINGAWWRKNPAHPAIQHLHRGIAGYLSLMIVASVLSGTFGIHVLSFKDAVMVPLHFAVKNGLVWIVLFWGILSVTRREGVWSALFAGWLALFSLNFIYLVVQRYTGIDLSHGIGAVLPANRFAYGVYRVSGFTGHPLTLSFSLMTLLVTFLGLRLDPKLDWTRSEARLLSGLIGVVVAGLGVTGSRWPMFVALGSFILCEGARIRRWMWQLTAGACLAAGFLYWEKSILGRFMELLQGNVPLEERFERLVFWKVHLKMFWDNPIYGVGLAASDAAKLQYYDALGYNKNIYNAHNVYLQTLADSGLIGFSGLLLFFAGFGVAIHRLAGAGGTKSLRYLLVSILLGALMQNSLRDSEYVFTVWFSLALVISVMASKSKESLQVTHQRNDGREPTQNI